MLRTRNVRDELRKDMLHVGALQPHSVLSMLLPGNRSFSKVERAEFCLQAPCGVGHVANT